MTPSGWNQTDYPACWDSIVVEQHLLKFIEGGNLSAAQLKACEKFGGLKKADLESACNPNTGVSLAINILIGHLVYIDTRTGECDLSTAVADDFEKRGMNAGVFNRALLILIVMQGAWKKNPKFNQVKTAKGFSKAAFGEESLPRPGL